MISSLLFLLAINVSSLATAGSGTAASPWTGWDTAITWVGSQQYNFPSGVYAYSTSPNFLKTDVALIGEAGTVLKHTGAGNAVIFDDPSFWTEGVRFENFFIQGNPSTTNGLFIRGVRNSIFRNISVKDVSAAAMRSEACVTNMLENFRCIYPSGAAYGIVLASRGGDGTTTWTIINPVIERTTQIGIWIQSGSFANTIINGTSESNLGKGAVIDGLNTIINTDFEANGGNNIELNSPRNVLIGVASSSKPMIIGPNSHLNQIIGGEYSDINISGSVNNVIQAAIVGNLTDNGVNTIKLAYGLGVNARFESKLGNSLPTVAGLAITGGVVSTNALISSTFAITANQNFLLDNPTNPSNGQKITWRIDQRNGSQISYGSKFRASPGNNLPQLALFSGIYYISAMYNSNFDTWDVQP